MAYPHYTIMRNKINKLNESKWLPLCSGLLILPMVAQAQIGDTIVLNRTIDEIVVQTAYGSARKSTLTGAISQVESKDIAKRPVSNVTSALEGVVSGIQVSSTYGQPGEIPLVNIRGIGTVNGTIVPLYVLDGVPFSGNITDLNPNDIESITVLKDAASCALYGNRASNGVILITTKHGKGGRVSVDFSAKFGSYSQGMKDYKRLGVRQFMNASWLDYRNSLATGTNAMSIADASKYASENIIGSYLKLNIFNKSDNQLFDNDGLLVGDANVLSGYAEDLDWLDQATRNGFRQEYNVSASQSSERSDGYYSAAYLKEEGYVKNSGFERLNGRAVQNFRPTNWLKTGFTVMGSHQKQNVTSGKTQNGYGNVFFYSRYMAPIYPVHLHATDGSYLLDAMGNRQYDTGFDGDRVTRDQYAGRHLIWENELNRNFIDRDVMRGSAYATVRFLDGFSFTVNADGSINDQKNTVYYNAKIGEGSGSNGIIQQTNYKSKTYTLQEQLAWSHSFGGHDINVLIGHENYDYSYDYRLNEKTNQTFEGNLSLSNFSTTGSITGYTVKYRTESYLGRVRYNYLDRYNVEASYRRDGTSRFSKDSRWGNFGSVGANWIVSKEAFMQNVDWVNFLKLRADYGQVGNDAAAGYYAYMSLYKLYGRADEPSYWIGQLGNNNLKWETSQSFGVAAEARMFNRWNLSVEYFDKRTKDLLFNVYLPLSAGSTSGFSQGKPIEPSILNNIGTMSNRGIEINTDVDIFKSGDWTVNFSANATFCKNKVLKLPEQNKEGILVPATPTSPLPYKIEEGRSMYNFYTYTFAGVDQLTGNSLYKANLDEYYVKGADGNIVAGNAEGADMTAMVTEIGGKYYVNNTTYAMKEYHGSALPKVYGSFSPTVSYKSLTVSALFTFSLGGKVYDNVYRTLMSTTGTPTNLHKDILNSWTSAPEGMTAESADRLDPNGIPQINNKLSQYNNAESSRWLVNASYLVLKNLYASYSLPTAWTRTVGLQNVRLNLSCENIFTLTKRQGMNPQQSFSGAQLNYLVTPRIVTVGVDVKF